MAAGFGVPSAGSPVGRRRCGGTVGCAGNRVLGSPFARRSRPPRRGVSLVAVYRVAQPSSRAIMPPRDPIRGHCQAGSLTGAVHLPKSNAGVLRAAQRGQKPRVEQKGKSCFDPDVQ